jgi:hypothetical protein
MTKPFKIALITMKLMFFFPLLFSTIICFAQPVLNIAQPVGGGDRGQSDPNQSIDEQRKQQEFNEIVEMKMAITNMDNPQTMEENEKLDVNIDSMYQAHFEARELSFAERDKIYVTKIIPHARREKLTMIDSSLVKFLRPINSKFSVLELTKNDFTDKVKDNLSQFDQTTEGFRFTSTDILQGILPPLVLGSKPLTVNEYKNIVSKVFITYPGLIYFCDKGFLNMMRSNKYNTIMQMQKRTLNVIDVSKFTKS